MTLNEQQLIEAATAYTLRTLAYNRAPVFVRGQNTRVWDMSGKEYIDWGLRSAVRHARTQSPEHCRCGCAKLRNADAHQLGPAPRQEY